MKKLIISSVILIGLIAMVFQGIPKKRPEKVIGVIVPIEHQAMRDMTDGFVEKVNEHFGSRVLIDIQNAQGDGTLQKAIIENFKRKCCGLIVPIGTDAALMTQHLVKKQPILGLDVTNRITQEQLNITGLKESPIAPSYQFIKQLVPGLKKVAMVYSASDKNVEMVRLFEEAAARDGVAVQPIMIQSLADLYLLAQSVNRDADALFIAKDHLAASGASSIAQVARKLQIPFIASDEGSVAAGAAVALGNREREIGIAGGALAIQLLEGVKPQAIPILPLIAYTVFVNRDALKNQGFSMEQIQKAAAEMNYPTVTVQGASRP